MLLDAITKNFEKEGNELRLHDAVAYRQDAGHALNQLSIIWNNGQDVVPEIEALPYVADETQRMLLAAEKIFPEIKLALQKTLSVERVPDCVALLGDGSANGHAILADGHSYAWIALEAFTSEQQLRVFMTHELCHAIHYQMTPDWYPHDKDQYHTVGRAIFTDGLSTWLTMQALGITRGEALWADYAAPEWIASWTEILQKDSEQDWQELKTNWTERGRPGLFVANEEASPGDNRAGYFYGLTLVERLAKIHSLQKLLTLTPDEVTAFVESDM